MTERELAKMISNWFRLPIIAPFPPGMTPAGSSNFSLEALMSNANAYAEAWVSIATAGTNVTLTAAQVLAKNIVLTVGASGAFALTLPPTARILDALGPTIPRDGSFYFPLYISNRATTFTATLTAADGSTTLSGSATLEDNANGKWIVRVNAATTAAAALTLTFARISTCDAGGGGGGAGTGTVTSVSVTTQNGVAATVTNPTTTPALAFNLGVGGPVIIKKAEGTFLEFNNASAVTLADLNILGSTTSASLGLGLNALAVCGSNKSCIAIGMNALAANTTGTSNTGIGNGALAASIAANENTAVGRGALASSVTGNNNTALGTGALGAANAGANNTALGHTAGGGIIAGSSNTCVGYVSMNSGASGNDNCAFGEGTLSANTGTGNTAIGLDSMIANTAGTYNSALGWNSLVINTTGSYNVGLGYHALLVNTTGSKNIGIGFEAGPSAAAFSKSIAIGASASAGASNAAVIGATGSGNEVNVGINMAIPTARLHLPAGTATAGTGPLKLTSGTNLTTAEAGTVEYNGTNLFFTRSGTTREGVLTQSAVTTEVAVSDTTVTVNIGGVTYKLLAKA